MSGRRLWHDFHNIAFKTKHKLYIASGSTPTPPPPQKKIWVRLCSVLVIRSHAGPQQNNSSSTLKLTSEGYGCSHTALNCPENIRPVCTFPLEAGIVAHLCAGQVRNRGSILVRDKRFFSSPQQLEGLWGPSRLQFNRCRGIFQWPGQEADPLEWMD
jgi:hypothetical protein